MGTPDSYLPPALSAETITSLILSLDLPAPSSMEPLQVKAAFHSIYLIHFASAQGITARENKDDTVTLVLRVSGRHQDTQRGGRHDLDPQAYLHSRTGHHPVR